LRTQEPASATVAVNAKPAMAASAIVERTALSIDLLPKE
jgi:hypothetical protein